ncbi:adenylyl-sulfate kinase [Nocardioides cynanchi]|uniref:adenylyl-sulfate kinase n=1 Tax=Nocardioides cynanchi TaxID=2558918 RepID=UPI0012480E41|nr:adenylyl-sulfate kinase [Nocardioides cynanchi]
MPQHCPSPRELADLELLTGGAFTPVSGFNEPGSPITLELPEELRGQEVELVDPEGLPLARLSADGTVEPLTHAQHGPFRRLHLSPAHVREQYAGSTFVPVVDALTTDEIDRLREVGTPVVLLALTGPGTPELSTVALLRASLAAAGHLPDAAVVAVPLASHGDPSVDHELGIHVVAAYAGPDPVLALGDTDGDYPEDIAAIVEGDQPGPDRQGLVLFFTGLSGSGKSTVAQAVIDSLLEQGERSITSLDGDVVRRNLSAGLTFSRADRETNIRRIGWVAAEISRHGGVAVCSPIAPFDRTRQDVRAMTEAAGGAFFLVHVATPLEECERRDRKGMYAKARRGEIPDFTGISSPYEPPDDADLRIDTTGRSIEDCRDEVLDALVAAGRVAGPGGPVVEPATSVVERSRDHDPVVEPAASVVERSRDQDPLRVLFVCTANICRSPYLELRARQLLGPDSGVEVSSAGTHGFDASPVSDTMAAEFARHGTDVEAFRSRAATGELVDAADLVLTAEASHRTRLLEDRPAAFRKIFTLGQFVASAQAADPSLRGRELIEALANRRVAASPAHDIDDPYRRGPEAARRAAVTMEALLEVAVDRLRRPAPTDRTS